MSLFPKKKVEYPFNHAIYHNMDLTLEEEKTAQFYSEAQNGVKIFYLEQMLLFIWPKVR